MTPAGGSMEAQTDTSWGKLLEFLTSVGVDINDAYDADIHISAGATEGAVMVTSFARDDSGRFFSDGEQLKTEVKTYSFSRVLRRPEPRLVQEEQPDV